MKTPKNQHQLVLWYLMNWKYGFSLSFKLDLATLS